MSVARAESVLRLAVLVAALLCAAGLWRVIAVIGLRLPLDPNEGWNAYHAASAMTGGALYPGPPSYMVDNYPPLSFYVVGTLGRLLGDNIVAGRIISLLSFVFVAFGIFVAAGRLGCKRAEAGFAALLFAGGMLVFTDYVGMNDPQMLAHAVATGGFLLLLRAPRSLWRIAVAALLFTLAAFVKHNIIVMALAMTAWLAMEDRRSALRLIGFGGLFLLTGLALFRLVYGVELWTEIASARTYSLADLRDGFVAWLHWSLVPLTGLGSLVWQRRTDPSVRLCAVMAALGLALGVCFLGGAGVDANVLFDADIALALGAALFLSRLAGGAYAGVAAAAYAAPLILAAWTNAGDDWRTEAYWLHPMRNEAHLAQSDIAFLQSRNGPALCEMLSLCYWAGKPATVDVFNIGEAFDAGARSDGELTAMIDARRFAVIQFNPDSPYSLGQNVHDAVARAYRLAREDDNGDFYVPR